MTFLYDNFDTLTKFGVIPNKRFSWIDDNLTPKFPVRDYQIKSFSRFDYLLNANFEGKSQIEELNTSWI